MRRYRNCRTASRPASLAARDRTGEPLSRRRCTGRESARDGCLLAPVSPPVTAHRGAFETRESQQILMHASTLLYTLHTTCSATHLPPNAPLNHPSSWLERHHPQILEKRPTCKRAHCCRACHLAQGYSRAESAQPGCARARPF